MPPEEPTGGLTSTTGPVPGTGGYATLSEDAGGSTASSSDTGGGTTDGGASVETSATGESDASTTGEATGTCGAEDCPCAVRVNAGLDHTCVVLASGAVMCWGNDSFGEMGHGTTSVLPQAEPTEVPIGEVSRDVEAGFRHACAITADEEVWCWGRNDARQVSPESDAPQLPPTQIDAARGSSLLALGAGFSCAVSGQSLTCWGGNGTLQLGSEDPAEVEVTVELGSVPLGMTAGAHHLCTWDESVLQCRGRNPRGQLGSGTAGPPTSLFQTVALPGQPLSAIAGDSHTCAVVDDGRQSSVLCWGDNRLGQLTSGTVDEYSAVPVAVEVPGEVLQLLSLRNTTCARTDREQLYCWGGARGEHLGLVTSEGQPIPQGDLVLIPSRSLPYEELSEGVAFLTARQSHLCALSSIGHVWCWGNNSRQQLGPVAPVGGNRTVRVGFGSSCAG